MRIGNKHPRQVDVTAMNAAKKMEKAQRNAAAAQNYTARERDIILKKIMALPEDKRVEALLSNGFINEANELERKLAEDYLAKQRADKLAEIMALPVDERLEALVAHGFDEEAKSLSEQLAEGEGSGDSSDAGTSDDLTSKIDVSSSDAGSSDAVEAVEDNKEKEEQAEAPAKKGRPGRKAKK